MSGKGDIVALGEIDIEGTRLIIGVPMGKVAVINLCTLSIAVFITGLKVLKLKERIDFAELLGGSKSFGEHEIINKKGKIDKSK